MKSIVSYVKGVAGICRMEMAPQLLPYSTIALLFSLLLFGAGRYQVHSLDHSQFASIQVGLWASVVLMAVTVLVLALGKRLEAVARTLTALAATGAVVALTNAAFRIIIFAVTPEDAGLSKMTGFLTFPLFIWNVMVFAYIFRHAFSGRPVLALALSGFCILPISFVLPAIFPA